MYVTFVGSPLPGVLFSKSYEPNLGEQDTFATFSFAPQADVNLATGNLMISLPLLTTRGRGLSASVSLIYNSLETSPGLMGPGWRHNYQIYLTEHHNETAKLKETISLTLGDGRTVIMRWNDEYSRYIADDEFGYFSSLRKNVTARDNTPAPYIEGQIKKNLPFPWKSSRFHFSDIS